MVSFILLQTIWIMAEMNSNEESNSLANEHHKHVHSMLVIANIFQKLLPSEGNGKQVSQTKFFQFAHPYLCFKHDALQQGKGCNRRNVQLLVACL